MASGAIRAQQSDGVHGSASSTIYAMGSVLRSVGCFPNGTNVTNAGSRRIGDSAAWTSKTRSSTKRGLIFARRTRTDGVVDQFVTCWHPLARETVNLVLACTTGHTIVVGKDLVGCAVYASGTASDISHHGRYTRDARITACRRLVSSQSTLRTSGGSAEFSMVSGTTLVTIRGP